MENIEKNKSISYLTFSIGKEKFAAHVSKVQKIVEMQEITTMPQSPDFLLGVINLNGLVLPIIDSRIKMGFPVTEATSDTCTIVCEIVIEEEQIMAGILVDSVDQVLEIEKEEILPPPSMGKKYKNAYIKGVFNVDDSFTMLLDLDSFFTTDELLQLADMKKDSDRVEELKKKKREKEKEKQKQK